MTEKQLFIVHVGIPYVMAEVHSFRASDHLSINECESKISVGSKTTVNGNTAVLDAVLILPNKKFSELSSQTQADKLASLMRRMADWYHAYLKWQEDQKREE